MSYQEKNILVSLANAILLSGYYLVNLMQIYAAEVFIVERVYGLWATSIALAIIAAIISSIITQIAVAIATAIITQEEDGDFFVDERDKHIDLQGIRNAYFITSIGVFFTLLSAVLGQPMHVMFNVLVIFVFAANIIGDVSKLFHYRRGF